MTPAEGMLRGFVASVLESPDGLVSPRWARHRRLRLRQLLDDLDQVSNRDQQLVPADDAGLWFVKVVAQLFLDERFDLIQPGEVVVKVHGRSVLVRVLP